MSLTLITLRITSWTLTFFFVSDLAPFSNHGQWEFRHPSAVVAPNLGPLERQSCNKINTYNFYVPLDSSPRIAWIDMNYDDRFTTTNRMTNIQAVLYNRDQVEVERTLIPLRRSPNAQPALLPMSWEFSEPWMINFSYQSVDYENTTCIKSIVVDHVDFKRGIQSSDPVELSTKVVDQI